MALRSITKQVRHFICHSNSIIYHNGFHNSGRLFCSETSNLNPTTLTKKSEETSLLRHIRGKISLKGPITVAEYMKEVLTHPSGGYYMNRDVFGASGDFITSPEISQMFGELVGIWCVNEWLRCGSPSKINIVELGPGRGTLADDILRVCSKFAGIRDAVSLHLVEVSPALSRIQRRTLVGSSLRNHTSQVLSENPALVEYSSSANQSVPMSEESSGERAPADDIDATEINPTQPEFFRSQYGADVRWYRQLADVPTGFSFYVAHEFLDALPIHKFQRKSNKWHEVLMDVDDNVTSEHHLRYVLSSRDTAASTLLLKVDSAETRDHIELCPDAGIILRQIAGRIEQDGGYALIADYGHSGDKTDTFRGFRNHNLFDPLREPGSADLTADVDFRYLDNIVKNIVCTHGPVTQQQFLFNMGIQVRLEVLLSRATPEQRKTLMSGFDMLTNPDKMGQRFKFFSMLHRDMEKSYLPAGFE